MDADAGEFRAEIAAHSIDDVARRTTQPLVGGLALLRASCQRDSVGPAQRTNIADHRVQFGFGKPPDARHSAIGDSVSDDSRQRLIVRRPAEYRSIEIRAFSTAPIGA